MSDTAFSNSYIESDAELESLIGGDKRTSAIALKAATAADQEAYCQEATRHIDDLPFRGRRYEVAYIENGAQKDIDEDGLAQVLEFPRVIDGVTKDWDYGTDLPLVPAAVKRACMEEAIAVYDIRNSADKRTRLDLQRQGVTAANYSGTSEQFVTNPSGGVSGAGDRYHGLLSYEAYRLLRKYVGACLR
jgi:hypothetical protein